MYKIAYELINSLLYFSNFHLSLFLLNKCPFHLSQQKTVLDSLCSIPANCIFLINRIVKWLVRWHEGGATFYEDLSATEFLAFQWTKIIFLSFGNLDSCYQNLGWLIKRKIIICIHLLGGKNGYVIFNYMLFSLIRSVHVVIAFVSKYCSWRPANFTSSYSINHVHYQWFWL